jgi:hypothetical protein
VVNAMHQPLYPAESDPVPIVQEAGWAPGSIRMGAKNLPSTRIFYSFSYSLYFSRTQLFVLIVLGFCLCLYCTTHTTQTSMPPTGLKSPIPATRCTQTLAFDCSTTRISRFDPQTVHPIASHYTNYTTPPTYLEYIFLLYKLTFGDAAWQI